MITLECVSLNIGGGKINNGNNGGNGSGSNCNGNDNGETDDNNNNNSGEGEKGVGDVNRVGFEQCCKWWGWRKREYNVKK